jgi:hypothetical protein
MRAEAGPVDSTGGLRLQILADAEPIWILTQETPASTITRALPVHPALRPQHQHAGGGETQQILDRQQPVTSCDLGHPPRIPRISGTYTYTYINIHTYIHIYINKYIYIMTLSISNT